MLNVRKNTTKDIIVGGFSSDVNQLCNLCLNELSSAYIPTKSRLNYFVKNGGYYHLHSSLRSLGYLSPKDNNDITFKKFISSLRDEVGDFYAVVFPIDVNWFPHFGEIVVYKTEESFAKTDYIIRKRVQVKDYDSYNSAIAISNIGFNLRCNHDERHQKIVDMLLSCNGNAYAMCKRLNESKAGYTNWKVIKDDYTSQKLESTDDLGNVRYLEIVM